MGHPTGDDPSGHFGEGTAAAVLAFQSARGLRTDGVCGPQTWAGVIEAGWQLGDRWLYRSQPMLRGDDVAALQRRLGALGFDPGRVDGIFGPDSERALQDFQANAGLTVDGICGPDTLRALHRLGTRCAAEPVAAVREREALRRGPRGLRSRGVVIGHTTGFDALARSVARALRAEGAFVVVARADDGSRQAREANEAAGDVFVGFVPDVGDPGCRAAYFRGVNWESPTGRRLAELLAGRIPSAAGVPSRGVQGMSVPVLRETRMPAVLCEIGPPDAVNERSAEVAAATVEALTAWVRGDGEP